MRNWIGQEIEVGSVVGRGARCGNTSDFKIGIVMKLVPDKFKATVEWKFSSTYVYDWIEKPSPYPNGRPIRERVDLGYGAWETTGKGSPSIESLFLLTDQDLWRAEQSAKLVKEYNQRSGDGNPMDRQEFLDRMAII